MEVDGRSALQHCFSSERYVKVSFLLAVVRMMVYQITCAGKSVCGTSSNLFLRRHHLVPDFITDLTATLLNIGNGVIVCKYDGYGRLFLLCECEVDTDVERKPCVFVAVENRESRIHNHFKLRFCSDSV